MSTISLDYINDIINTCKKGNLLITYYRNYDVGLERIEELFKYIYEHKSPDYNWVKIDVSNCPDVCVRLGIHHIPCTVLYNHGEPRSVFGSYETGSNIANRIKMLYSYRVATIPHTGSSEWYPMQTQERDMEPDDDGDDWFFDNTVYPRIGVTNE